MDSEQPEPSLHEQFDIDQFDLFLIDLDGVMYLDEQPINDSIDAVNRLRDTGKTVRFITNDPRHTRQNFAELLSDIGVSATKSDVVTSGSATASYLSNRSVETVAVVGSSGLETELKSRDLVVTDDSPDAVVVGASDDTSYLDIKRAAQHIYQGAEFIGTNPDKSYPTPEGPAPGVGAILEAVKAVIETEPTIIGKPHQLMFDMAMGDIGSEGVAVIGDNPATDIVGANRSNLTSILLDHLGSVEESRENQSQDQRPDIEVSSLSDLFTEHG